MWAGFIRSFLDRRGNPNFIKLTVFFSFAACVVMWIAEQFFYFKANETMFITFSGIAVSGMGINNFAKKEKDENTEIK